MCWLYRKIQTGRSGPLYVVGFYTFSHDDDGRCLSCDWHDTESFDDERQARALVNFLNGGNISTEI